LGATPQKALLGKLSSPPQWLEKKRSNDIGGGGSPKKRPIQERKRPWVVGEGNKPEKKGGNLLLTERKALGGKNRKTTGESLPECGNLEPIKDARKVKPKEVHRVLNFLGGKSGPPTP